MTMVYIVVIEREGGGYFISQVFASWDDAEAHANVLNEGGTKCLAHIVARELII